MKIIESKTNSVTVELSSEEIQMISGIFAMISADPNPAWWTSTGEEASAMKPEQYDEVYDEWTAKVVQASIDSYK